MAVLAAGEVAVNRAARVETGKLARVCSANILVGRGEAEHDKQLERMRKYLYSLVCPPSWLVRADPRNQLISRSSLTCAGLRHCQSSSTCHTSSWCRTRTSHSKHITAMHMVTETCPGVLVLHAPCRRSDCLSGMVLYEPAEGSNAE